MSTPQPPPRRGLPTSLKIFLAVVGVLLLLAGGALYGLVQFFKELAKPSPPVPIEAVASLATTSHPDAGETLITLDWTLAPDTRPTCYRSIDVSVTVNLPDGRLARGADVIGLWGTDLGERSTVRDSSASVSVWPCRAGTMHVFAQLEGVGAAEIPCTLDPTFAASSTDGQVPGFRCSGVLDPHTRLALPEPPRCPEGDELKPLFDLIAPGACFGLTALELSRLPYPSIHVSTTSYEDFRPWPKYDGPAPRFEIPLGAKGRTHQLGLDGRSDEAARLYPLLLAMFGGRDFKPKCDFSGRAINSWEHPLGHAVLIGELKNCDPKKASSFRFTLKQGN